MKIIDTTEEGGPLVIELTRRNLVALLDKLDFVAGGGESAVTLEKAGIAVRGVEDFEHYGDREPGPVLDNAGGFIY